MLLSASPGEERFFGAITSPSQENTHQFTLVSPTNVWFDSQTNDASLKWLVTGPNGIVPTPSFGLSVTPFSSDDQNLGLLPAGTYEVKVSTVGNHTGAYSFRVLDMASAPATTITLGTSVSATLSPANSTRLYRFSGTAGSTILLDNTSFTTSDPGDRTGDWLLFDSSGRQLGRWGLRTDSERITLATSGTYTLVLQGAVDAVSNASNPTSVFVVRNVIDTTTALTLGTAASGNVSSIGQNLNYTFTLASPTSLWFDSQTNNNNLRWTLTGPTGLVPTTLGAATPFSFGDENLGLLPAGTYRLTVGGAGSSTGAFAFNLLDLASATSFTAGTSGSPLGVTQSGALTPGNSTRLYKFVGTAGDSLAFDNVSVSIGTNATWRLIDAYGSVIYTANLGSDRSGVSLSTTGTYTLALYGSVEETNTTSYSFRVNYESHTAPPEITGAALVFGTQYDSTTNPIGASVSGEAEFQFTLAGPTALWFDSQTNDGSITWLLTGPAGIVRTPSAGTSPTPFSFNDQSLGMLPAGTYSLQVFGVDGTEYAFNLRDVASATSLTLNTSVTATLSPANSTRLYQFSGTAGSTIFLDNTSFTTSDPFDRTGDWQLFDSYGRRVGSWGLNADSGRITLATTGTYTLVLQGDINAISNPTDPSVTFVVRDVTDITTALTLGTAVSGSFSSIGQNLNYTFTLAAPTSLWFDSQTDNNNLNWILTGPTGIVPTPSVGSTVTPFNFDDQDLGLLPAGTYRLTVGGAGSSTGAFAFNLLDFASATSLTLGTSVTATLSPANSTRLYQFSGTAGSTILLDNTGYTSSDPNNRTGDWLLFDSSGRELGSWGLRTDSERITLATSGTYTLALQGDMEAESNPSNPTSVFVVRNVIDTTTALTLGTAVSGNVSSIGQNLNYTFTLAAPTWLRFDSQTNTGNLNWILTGPTGIVPIPFVGASVTPFNFDDQNLGLLPAGSYQLTVGGAGSSTGAFAFNLLDFASATSLTLGTSVTATLSPANSTRLYQFSGTAGSTILLDNTGFTSSDPNNRTGDWLLFDSYGRELGSWGLRTDSERITLATSGTYTLVLQGAVDAVSNPSNPTSVFVVRNVADTTTALTLGTAVSGNVSSIGQNLNYTFTLAAPTSLWFDSRTNIGNLNWILTGPTGIVPTPSFGSFVTPFNSGDQNLGLLPAGTYRLTVGGAGSSTGAFAFNLLDFASATSFSAGTSGSPVGATQSGALNPGNSTRLYKFAGTAGDSLTFDNVAISLGTNATWQLIDAYGAVIYTANLGSDRIGVPLSTTGMYTLALSGAVGETNTTNYSFRVNYDSHTAPPEITGAALVFGTQYDSTTNPIGALVSGEAEFQFTLAGPTSLWFDSQTNDSNISWLLSGPTGIVRTPLAGTNPTPFHYDDQSLGLLPAGTYSLKVFGGDGTEYAFNLRDVASATSMALGTSVTATLSPANSTRLYQFSGTAGSTIFLDNTNFTSSDPDGDTGDWLLFDSYGRQVGSWDLNADSGRITLATTGTYTLVLQGSIFATSNPTDPSATFVVRDVTDITTALSLGTAVSGSFSSIGQNLNYTFTLAAPTSLWFDSQTRNNNLHWTLTGPTGFVSTTFGDETPLSFGDENLGLLPAGTYRLTIGGFGSSTGAFGFNLLNLASATGLTLDTSVTSTLSPANSTRLYQFSGTAGSTIFLDNTSFTTSDPEGDTGIWQLVDPYGREVDNWNLSNDSGRITLSKTGTYTLVLQGDIDAVSSPSNPTAVFVVRNVIDNITQLWGTSGDDEITVQHISATSRDVYLNSYLMGTLTGSTPLTIAGMGGSDTVTIIGTNTSDTFAISPNAVTVGTAEVSLLGIENRIIDGLGGDDTFSYSGTNSDLVILGGDGVDMFIAAAAATVFRIDGGANGGVMNHSASTVGVVLDFAAGKLTGVTQSANITSVVGSSRSDAPVGVDKTATTLEDAAYTFTAGDFAFTDPGDSPANALLSISIVGLTLASGDTLQLNGVAVTTGQTIPAASIPNLVYTPATNTHGANRSSFTFQIRDNGGTTNGGIDIDPTVRVMTLSITSLNDVPVRTAGTISTLTVLEDSTTTSLGLTNIAYGTGGGPAESAQTLTYRVIAVPTVGKILLADGTTEVLANTVYTLSQLQGLSFQPTPNANGSSTFIFSVQDSGGTADGGIDTLTQSINVNVTAVNDIPVALPSSVTTNEDTPRSFSVSNFLFADIEANALSSITISSLTLVAGDTLQLNGVAVTVGQTISAAGISNLVYTPAADSNESSRSSFAFRVNDSDLGIVAATMSLNVTAVNDIPVALTSSVTLNEDTSRSFTVSDFLFTDVEANALSSITISSLTLAAGDTLQLNGVAVTVGQTIPAASILNLVYTPAANSNGSARSSFAFRVNDSGPGIVAATMSLNVTAVNDVPTALTSSVTTNEDTPRSFTVSNFLFADIESNALTSITISNLTLAAGDTLQLNGVAVTDGQTISAASIPNLVYTPAANSNGLGRSSFVFRANDSDSGIVTATMSLHVTAANDVPTALTSSVTTNEDTPRSFSVSNFLFTDTEVNALSSITISSLTLAAGDTLRLNGVAVTVGQTISAASISNLVYTPAANSNGIARSRFTFKVNDDGPGVVAATMSLNVTAVNDVPVAVASNVTTNEDTPRSFSVSNFRFTDREANALVSITISSLTLAAGDTLRLNGVAVTVGQTISAASIPKLVYTPAANSNGLARSRFTFKVNDGDPGIVAATMLLNVTAVNDVPVAVASSVTTNRNTARFFTVSSFRFTDTEKNALRSITISILTLAAGDTLRLNGVAVKVGQKILASSISKLVYTPAANMSGTARSRFTFKVNDAGSGVVAATMLLNVARK